MEKYKWIFWLFIPIAAIPVIVITLFVILKIYERLFNKLFKKLDEKDVFSGPRRKPSPIVVNITKIMIEILVGLTIFAICIRILSLPIYLLASIKSPNWTPPLFILISLIVIPYFFSAITAFKIIQFIHRNLDLNASTETPDIKIWTLTNKTSWRCKPPADFG